MALEWHARGRDGDICGHSLWKVTDIIWFINAICYVFVFRLYRSNWPMSEFQLRYFVYIVVWFRAAGSSGRTQWKHEFCVFGPILEFQLRYFVHMSPFTVNATPIIVRSMTISQINHRLFLQVTYTLIRLVLELYWVCSLDEWIIHRVNHPKDYYSHATLSYIFSLR